MTCYKIHVLHDSVVVFQNKTVQQKTTFKILDSDWIEQDAFVYNHTCLCHWTVQFLRSSGQCLLLKISSVITTMLSISKVLVSDAVHESCVKLLETHGISVDCKLKLTEDQLVKEIPVNININ